MNFPTLTYLILLVAFSILIFWPFFNNDKLYRLIKRQSPIFSLLTGAFFAAMAIALHYLTPDLANGIFSNSRILLILYSGLVGGPLAVITSSSLIVFTRDLLGYVSELTVVMKWHTLITGMCIAWVAMYKPITLKNLHYYYAITLAQFSVIIAICYVIYDIPMHSLFNFIVFFIVAYVAIYYILKKFDDTSIQLRAMKQLHMQDYLTEMPNNRSSEEYLQNLLNKKVPFELLHIDIDSFKNFNAEHTYRAGNEVLRQMARILHKISDEKEAFVGRIGGDEFCFILVNSSPANAVQIAYEITKTVKESTFYVQGQPFSVSVSICACSSPQNGKTLEELYLSTINGLKAIHCKETSNIAHVNQLKLEGKLKVGYHKTEKNGSGR